MAVGNVDDVKIGDTVIFGKYSGSDRVQVDGDDLLILELKDLKAVIYE